MFLVEWKFAGFIIFIILFIYENEPRCAYLGSFFLWVCRPFFVNFMFLMCLTAHYAKFSSLETGLNRAFWKILMQKNINLSSSFHLKSVESFFSLRNYAFVTCHCEHSFSFLFAFAKVLFVEIRKIQMKIFDNKKAKNVKYQKCIRSVFYQFSSI